jgi:hypothetical protein
MDAGFHRHDKSPAYKKLSYFEHPYTAIEPNPALHLFFFAIV